MYFVLQLWRSDVSVKAAVDQVIIEGMPLRESARLYNVPVETLRRRVNGTVTIECKSGPKTVLNEHAPYKREVPGQKIWRNV